MKTSSEHSVLLSISVLDAMFFKLCGGPGQILAAYQGEIGLEENAKVRGSLRFYFC
jgi:hypothetical protein